MSSSKDLAKLIADSEQREHECRDFLPQVHQFLFRETVKNIVYVENEFISNSGRTDYFVSGTITDDLGNESNVVYIWELKAPQCLILEQETKNRLWPSGDFLSGENQLLYYYDELRGHEKFKARCRVTDSNNVRAGGIIIGCDATKIGKCNIGEPKRSRMFEEAIRIRKSYFHALLGIRIISWTTILDQLRQEEVKGKVSSALNQPPSQIPSSVTAMHFSE